MDLVDIIIPRSAKISTDFESEKEAIYADQQICKQAFQVETVLKACVDYQLQPEEALEYVLAGKDGSPSKPLGQTAQPFNLDKSLDLLLDPVTGSAHCTLTPYWSKKLGKTKLKAQQLSSRGGLLSCELKEDQVYILGKAITYLKGSIVL